MRSSTPKYAPLLEFSFIELEVTRSDCHPSGARTCFSSNARLRGSSSELSRFLTRPPLDDDLRFGEEFDRVFALTVEDAEEAFLPSAEWEIRHRRRDSNIDADIRSEEH